MLPEVLVPHFTLDIPGNPHASYRAAKKIDNTDGVGTYGLAVRRVIKFFHIRNPQPFYEPLSTAKEIRTVAKSVAVLIHERELLRQEGIPMGAIDGVGITIKVFKSAFGAPRGRLPMPGKGDTYVGLHSVGLWGVDSDGNIGFINSWGKEWGLNGLGSMSTEYLDKYLYDAWRQKNAEYGWSRWKLERMKPTSSSERYVRQWMIRNPSFGFRFRYHGRGHQFVLYEPDSMTGVPVEVIDLRNGFGLRLGWAHIFHIQRDSIGIKTSIVKEFFIWPDYRNQGYGKLLEDQVATRAKEWDAQRIQVYFHNIDSYPHVLNIGQSFAEKCGYKIHSVELMRPSISYIAEKYLNDSRQT